MNNFNYQLNELEDKILQLLQSSQLPIGIYHLLIAKISNNIEQLYQQEVQREASEMQKQQGQEITVKAEE